ncbi:MAG: hypothetical protein RBR97_18690 [Bacteroidales bacterium]|jgi:hypothetical protein|nr:hypothetical protein [Bacteroidales bacterium]
MDFSKFKNSKNLLTDEQMKNVQGGYNCSHGTGCTATNGETTRSWQHCNKDLMLSWALAWDAAGYTVNCYRTFYA